MTSRRTRWASITVGPPDGQASSLSRVEVALFVVTVSGELSRSSLQPEVPGARSSTGSLMLLSNGFYAEGLFSHQHAQVPVPGDFPSSDDLRRVGGSLAGRRCRNLGWALDVSDGHPSGLTRYAAEAEIVSFHSRRRRRLEGISTPPPSACACTRIFATLAEAATTVSACSAGSCFPPSTCICLAGGIHG